VHEPAVRLVLDNEGQHGSRWQSALSISAKIGCAPQTLIDGGKKAEVNSGKRAGVSSEMAERMKALERENRELRQGKVDQKTIRGIVFPTNEILRKASAYFAMAPLGECLQTPRGRRIGMRTGASRSATCCRSPLPPGITT
jgi:transposase